MSDYHYAYLAFGIDLGYSEKVLIQEVDEYGTPNLPWLRRDEEGYPSEDLSDAITRRLYELIPGAPDADGAYTMTELVKSYYGVYVLEHGWIVEGQTPGWVLCAHHLEVDGGDVLDVNPTDLLQAAGQNAMALKLEDAMAALGITPNKPRIGWMLLASR